MRCWLPFPLIRVAVLLALTVALVSAAWAHRGPAIDITDDVLAYVAAGGSLDDLCGPEGPIGHAADACDACRLVDNVSLAGADGTEVQVGHTVRATGFGATVGSFVPSSQDPVRQTRAPPRLI